MSVEAPLPVENRAPGASAFAVFFVSSFTSHVYSTLGLARRLHEMGYRVEYWGDSSIHRMVTVQGFPLHECSPTWYCHERILQGGWRAGMRDIRSTLVQLRTARERQRLLPYSITDLEMALCKQLSRCTPELMLIDPMLAAYVPLLQARGLRCVLLQDKPWPGPDPLVPPPTSHFLPRDTFIARSCMSVLWMWERVLLRLRRLVNTALGCLGFYTCQQLLPAVLEHVKKQGIVTKATRRVAYDLYLEGLEEWVLGAAETDLPRSRRLPDSVHYVGLWPDLQRKQARVRLPPVSGDSRVIYVSMGISMPDWRDDLALIHRVIEALQTIPCARVIVSAGNVKAFTALRALSKQVHIAPFLPQVTCLEQADLAVTHGGANTYRECIATNTPMLVFPRDYDQHGNAARVVRLGLGLMGSRRWDSPASIRRKAVQILEEKAFTQRVRSLNETLRRSDPDRLDCAIRTVQKVNTGGSESYA